MPIPAQQVIDRVRQVGLDAEGADYYDDVIDIIPAINASLEWLTAVISAAFGQKKMGEEVFQDLVQARVFQASNFSRVFFNSTDLGHEVWTILGVYIDPKVKQGGLLRGSFVAAIASPTAPKATISYPPGTDMTVITAGSNVDFTYIDKSTSTEVTNTFNVIAVNDATDSILIDTLPVTNLGDQLNAGDEMVAKQIFLTSSQTSTPTILSTATEETSLYRKDLAHLESDRSAKRLTIEEWAKNKKNPFRPGNTVLPENCEHINFAYLNYADYSAAEVPYTVPTEIEIRPSVANKIVTVFYAKKPSLIVAGTDTIEFPGFFTSFIFTQTLHYISIKQGDQTTLNTISNADIQNLLNSIT